MPTDNSKFLERTKRRNKIGTGLVVMWFLGLHRLSAASGGGGS